MSETNKDNLSEEDYLKKHLSNLESGKKQQISNEIDLRNHYEEAEIIQSNTKVGDLQFFNFDVNDLPCGRFYPIGTLIMVRPAEVKEIQSYSMVDDNNFYDVVEKMNGMLQSCIRIKYPDGRIASYLEIKDQDRLFLIFLIRELTFQQGNELSVKAICPVDNIELTIELSRKNFVFHEVDSNLDKFFDYSKNSYRFKLKNGKEYEVMPPNIGLQKSFTDYIIKENNEKRTPNLSFLKIIPFLLPGRTSISYEGIKAKLAEYENPSIMDGVSFQFLNSAISKMTFGIKELKKNCECGEEVHTDMQFPDGFSSIFVIPDAFESYIEK